MSNPFVPKMQMPISILLHSVVSFHLQMIMITTNRDEAVFHWRQIRYYRDYANTISDIEGLNPMMEEKEFHDYMKQSGEVPLLIEAIEKYNLLEVD